MAQYFMTIELLLFIHILNNIKTETDGRISTQTYPTLPAQLTIETSLR